MALINCPDCNKEVSSNAPACPGCGSPLSVDSEARGSGVKQLTTTQGTSKSIKLQGLFAFALMVIGACIIYVDMSVDDGTGVTGMFVFLAGLVWYIANRIRKWWHHD